MTDLATLMRFAILKSCSRHSRPSPGKAFSTMEKDIHIAHIYVALLQCKVHEGVPENGSLKNFLIDDQPWFSGGNQRKLV
ncbi:MAG: hypothetical protein ACLUHE_08955 [Christensenellales bacterium]